MRRIDDLQDRLLVEICCRLPCKSVLQCKSVSNRWFALISNLSFLPRFLCLQSDWQTPTICTLLFHDMFTNYPHPQPLYNSKFLAMSKLPGLKSRGLSSSFLPCSQDAPKCEDGEPALVLGDDDDNDGPAIVATYNDLVLCCTMENRQRDYNICNPYTKQWVVLPPAPRSHKTVKVQGGANSLPSRFTPFEFNVEMFSSETGEWKELNL